MLYAYCAVDLDGSPALESAAFGTDDPGVAACETWLDQRCDRDEDGGGLFCLTLASTTPGARFEVKQEGQVVAVVVRGDK